MNNDVNNQQTDHLFRNHYGKMVAVLTRIFGFEHLEVIEDAVQDTFIRAMKTWRTNYPENPEAWLTTAAKNRVIDLFRQLSSEKERVNSLSNGPSAMAIEELFLDDEIEDSQLRMIFIACHPQLDERDQLAFALKTVSGFSTKEIAATLLLKDETVKKRLSRARKFIQDEQLKFELPQGESLAHRTKIVLEVIYAIFNEGFHSNYASSVVQQELCMEAIRLVQLLLKNKITKNADGYALLALMCFHSARLSSKVNEENELIDLKHQDRSKWYFPLIKIGNEAMNQAVTTDVFSAYHFEAAIAGEHLKAKSFEETDWSKIIMWYKQLYDIAPSPINLLNQSICQLQLQNHSEAFDLLNKVEAKDLEKRAYLYYGTLAEYYQTIGDGTSAIKYIDQALSLVTNGVERKFLIKKKALMNSQNK